MKEKTLLLSRRMQSVADRISQGVVLADVGCDHGYLSIWLCRTGKIPSAIAMDVNKGPLQKARENVILYGLEKKIQLRLSDGLMKLEAGEVSSVAIAGMGGGLTCRILKARPDVVDELKELVLEPQSDVGAVREYLESIGFAIVDEDMVLEDGKFYPIIRAVPLSELQPEQQAAVDLENAADRQSDLTDAALESEVRSDEDSEGNSEAKLLRMAQLRYGAVLLERKHPVLRELLIHDRGQAERILGHLEKNPTEKSLARITELKKELQCIDTALHCYEM